MPELSGMALVQTLSPRPMIIFTTAYSHYAVESYDLNTLDYLLKPITFERFLAAINKAAGTLPTKSGASNEDEPTVFIKSGPQTYQVKIADILYLEKDGNYITVHLKDKRYLSAKT